MVDGPLNDRRHVPGVVGYVKTHHSHYLSPGLEETIAALRAGQRTPLFHIGGRFARWSWYLRLPHGAGHPWAGVVRCEAPMPLQADGEDLGDVVEVVFEAEPNAVTALVPAPA